MSCFIYLIFSLTLYDKQKRSERLFISGALKFIVETKTSRRNRNVFHFHLDPSRSNGHTRVRFQITASHASSDAWLGRQFSMHGFMDSSDRAMDSNLWPDVHFVRVTWTQVPSTQAWLPAIKFITWRLVRDGFLSISWFKSEKALHVICGDLPSNLRVSVEWNWD